MKVIAALAFMAFATPLYAQSNIGDFWMQFTTKWKGENQCLDVIRSGPQKNKLRMKSCGRATSQQWRLQPIDGAKYRLINRKMGSGMCVDIFNGGSSNNETEMRACDNYTGQYWSFRKDGDWHRLTTRFRGPHMCLDLFNGGPKDLQPQLRECARYTGQFWSYRAVGRVN